MYTKVKDILRTFEPDNHKMLRTSQPQNFFAGPYKKKSVSIIWLVDYPGELYF